VAGAVICATFHTGEKTILLCDERGLATEGSSCVTGAVPYIVVLENYLNQLARV
jgi:hypothetical protein